LPRAGVAFGDVAVPALADDVAIGVHHHRTDRDFVVLALRALGQRQRMPHPHVVAGRGRIRLSHAQTSFRSGFMRPSIAQPSRLRIARPGDPWPVNEPLARQGA
jgi:hypothetical protein